MTDLERGEDRTLLLSAPPICNTSEWGSVPNGRFFPRPGDGAHDETGPGRFVYILHRCCVPRTKPSRDISFSLSAMRH